MTRNPIGLLERALQFLRHSLGYRSTGRPNQNPIGLLEMALEISTAKANGCTSGACSCGEGEDCLASGWEKFVPPLRPQTEQPAQQQPEKPIL